MALISVLLAVSQLVPNRPTVATPFRVHSSAFFMASTCANNGLSLCLQRVSCLSLYLPNVWAGSGCVQKEPLVKVRYSFSLSRLFVDNQDVSVFNSCLGNLCLRQSVRRLSDFCRWISVVLYTTLLLQYVYTTTKILLHYYYHTITLLHYYYNTTTLLLHSYNTTQLLPHYTTVTLLYYHYPTTLLLLHLTTILPHYYYTTATRLLPYYTTTTPLLPYYTATTLLH